MAENEWVTVTGVITSRLLVFVPTFARGSGICEFFFVKSFKVDGFENEYPQQQQQQQQQRTKHQFGISLCCSGRSGAID